MSLHRIPDLPYCTRCGSNIDPSDAVPYCDRFGRPIPGQYRNWCLLHWIGRAGALPQDHPDFLIPRDQRTKAKDRRHLSMTVGHAAMHGDNKLRELVQSRTLGSATYIGTPLEGIYETKVDFNPVFDAAFETVLQYMRVKKYGAAIALARRSEFPAEPTYDTIDDEGNYFSREHTPEFWAQEQVK